MPPRGETPDSSGAKGALPGVSGAASDPPRKPPDAASRGSPGETRPRRGRAPADRRRGREPEGGLSAHVRASFPKQSWPASLRHRRRLLTLPLPAAGPAESPPAERSNGGSRGQRRAPGHPSAAGRPGRGSAGCR